MGRATDVRPTTVRPAVAGLAPGYFALVMATGILAIGSRQQGLHGLAWVLLAVAGIAYGVLFALMVLRLVWFAPRMVGDLTSHARGFTFLTLVAGTNVLGSACGVVAGWWTVARVLWWWSLPLDLLLLYGALFFAILGPEKPDLGEGINGSWFLLTVSTQSIASLGALLLARGGGDLLAFVCVALFALGLLLYLIVMTMVFLRWTFQPLSPTEAEPPSWIAAGAVAITVLAGSNLLAARATSGRVERLAPFIEGVVMAAWATATFWFPVMVAIGVWRHLLRRLPLRYSPSYWSLVFPLGMYGVATHRMRAATALAELGWLPPLTLAAALAAWAATMAGLVVQAVRTYRRYR